MGSVRPFENPLEQSDEALETVRANVVTNQLESMIQELVKILYFRSSVGYTYITEPPIGSLVGQRSHLLRWL